MNPAEEKMGPEALPTAEAPEPREVRDIERLLAKPLDLSSPMAALLDPTAFSQMQRLASIYASSGLVPEHFQGSIPNCFIAIQLAIRWDVDPHMVMQNVYVIHGKPGIQATLVIALVNTKGPFTGPIQWRYEGLGDTRKCTAYATHKVTGEVCEAIVDWDMVVAEGWASKSGSKWKTIPRQMFSYRSATFLTRLYCPEVLMGMKTADEVEDIAASETLPPPVTSDPTARSSALADKIRTKNGGAPKPKAEPKAEPKKDEPKPAELGVETEALDKAEPPDPLEEVVAYLTENDTVTDTETLDRRLLVLAREAEIIGKRARKWHVHIGNLSTEGADYLPALMDAINLMEKDDEEPKEEKLF